MMKKENSLVRKIYREQTIEKVSRKVKLLGVYCKYDVITLLNTRLLLSIAIFFVCIVFSKYGYFLAPFATISFYILSEYFLLDCQIKRREKKLENEALFFFEVLALTLESGRNLKGALDMTVSNIDSELSDEFKKTVAEIRLGKSLTEALKDMKERIPSDTINNVILNITQSNIFGNNIVDSLYSQVDFLREKKLMDVKSQIGKLPVKISAISVIFFIPIMLLLILAPVLINLIH